MDDFQALNKKMVAANVHSPNSDVTINRLPAIYGHFLVDLMRSRGLSEHDVLANTGLTMAQLAEHDRHISSGQHALILGNALRLSQDPGIAYEIGLASQLTKHGFIGFGLMSCATVRDALSLSQRFLSARVPLFHPDIRQEDDQIVVEMQATKPLGDLYQAIYDMVLVELCCLFGRLIHGGNTPSSWLSEIWVPYPEPSHYARYKDRLPRFRFNQVSPQIRFPVTLLDTPIASANPVTAQIAIAQCEQEMAQMVRGEMSISMQVSDILQRHRGQYPDLNTLAQILYMSERTLKRRLQAEDQSYQRLLDATRYQQACDLLRNNTLSVEAIAQALAYQDPTNFTRAFRKWSGLSPRDWRSEHDQTKPKMA